ncbi:MAG: hypothetical protein U1E34_12420 [Amaricoccus sp.]
MDVNRGLVVAAGCLLVGLLLGYSLGGSDTASAQLAATRTLDVKVSALDKRVAELETAIAGLQGSQSQGLQGLGTEMDGLGQSLAGSLATLGEGLSTALKSQIDELRDRLSALGEAPMSGGEATVTLTPGATVPLGEGLELFLAAIDTGAGTAMVAINGQALVQLTLGQTYETGGCRLTLTGFDAKGGAFVTGGC